MESQIKFGHGHVPSLVEGYLEVSDRLKLIPPTVATDELMKTIDVPASIMPEVLDASEQDKATKDTPAEYFLNIAKKGIQRVLSRLIRALRTVLDIYRRGNL
jgi:hypothetical protein